MIDDVIDSLNHPLRPFLLAQIVQHQEPGPLDLPKDPVLALPCIRGEGGAQPPEKGWHLAEPSRASLVDRSIQDGSGQVSLSRSILWPVQD